VQDVDDGDDACDETEEFITSLDPADLEAEGEYRARAAMKEGRYEESEGLYRGVLASRCDTLGEGHETTIATKQGLGVLLHWKGDLAGSEALLREVLDARRATLGEKHQGTIGAMSCLGLVLKDRGDFKSSEALLREASTVMNENCKSAARRRRPKLRTRAHVRPLLGRVCVAAPRAVGSPDDGSNRRALPVLPVCPLLAAPPRWPGARRVADLQGQPRGSAQGGTQRHGGDGAARGAQRHAQGARRGAHRHPDVQHQSGPRAGRQGCARRARSPVVT